MPLRPVSVIVKKMQAGRDGRKRHFCIGRTHRRTSPYVEVASTYRPLRGKMTVSHRISSRCLSKSKIAAGHLFAASRTVSRRRARQAPATPSSVTCFCQMCCGQATYWRGSFHFTFRVSFPAAVRDSAGARNAACETGLRGTRGAPKTHNLASDRGSGVVAGAGPGLPRVRTPRPNAAERWPGRPGHVAGSWPPLRAAGPSRPPGLGGHRGELTDSRFFAGGGLC